MRAFFLPFNNRNATDFGLDGIRYEALLMGQVMHFHQLGRARFPGPDEDGLGMQGNERNRSSPGVILAHGALRIINIAVHGETALGGDGQEPEHVATRKARDEGFLRIHGIRFRHRCTYDMWRR